MEIAKLNAGRGWVWIKQGFYLYKKSPLLLTAMILIAFLISILIGSIPAVGEPLSTIIAPVLFSGLLWGCNALEHDEELEIAHLFAGFKRNTQMLLMLGVLNLLGNYLIVFAMKLTGGGALIDLMAKQSNNVDPTVLMQTLSNSLFAILVGALLFVIYLLATQFAPMLVTFDKTFAVAALKTSLVGSWHNLVPLSIYGAIMIFFMIVATLPAGLGWFVLLPVMVTSMYAAYRGIFPRPEDENAVTVAEDAAA